MNFGVVFLNADGIITDANPSALKLLNLPLNELIGRKGTDSLWKAIRLDGSNFPIEEHPTHVSLHTKKTLLDVVMGIYHIDKDKYVWINVSSIPIFEDERNKPVGVYAVLEDTTIRIETEKLLERQTELQKILTKISASFINISDRAPRQLVNKSLKMLGNYFKADRVYIFEYEHDIQNIRNLYEWCNHGIVPQIDELQETPFSMVPDWIETHFKNNVINIPDVSQLDKDNALRGLLESQDIKSIITVPIFINDNCFGFVGIDSVLDGKIYADIDEEILRIFSQLLANLFKQITFQQQIIESKKFLDEVLDSSNSPIMIKDIEGRYQYVNRAMKELIKLSDEEIVGKTDFELYPKNIALKFARNDRKVFEENRLIVAEETFHRGTTKKYFISNKFPIKNLDGQPKSLCVIAHEITDQIARKEAEASNEAKSKFLSRMSHEFRTPLHAILGSSYVMQYDKTLNERHKKHLGSIIRSGSHLLQLISGILDFSKIETTEIIINKRTFSIEELLLDLELMFIQIIEEKSIELHFEIRDLPQYVSADVGKIRQVLVNIIGNSIKFTQKGSVTVNVQVLQKQPNAKHRILFMISDTGPGMSKENVNNIFNEFAQFSADEMHKGTGLGMPISKKLTDAMKGSLRIDSKLGTGTTTYFEVPIDMVSQETITEHNNKIGHDSSHYNSNSFSDKNITILIVDDIEDNRDTLHDLMEPFGFHIHEAFDGLDAVEKVLDIKPDFILMDIQMPRLDGYKASTEIKSGPLGKRLIIIAVTASELKKDEQKLIDAGIDDYLTKPFHPNELFEKLNYWVSKSS